MKVIDAVWEIRNLGKKTIEITIERADINPFIPTKLLENIEEQRSYYNAKYVVVKSDTRHPQVNIFLSKSGFILIENQIGLKLNREDAIATYENNKDLFEGVDYKLADKDDIDLIVSEIKKGIFTTDRIALDSNFGIEIANNRYALWLQDELQRGAIAYLTTHNGRPFGFGIIKKAGLNNIDDLLGGLFVGSENKNQGSLFKFANLKIFIDLGFDKAKTHVSSNNPNILQLHEMFGYKIINIKNVFIKHY